MNRKLSLLLSGLVSLGLVALACSSGETVVDTGTAGTTGTGSGTAGTTGTAGTSATGHAGTTGNPGTAGTSVTGTAGTSATGRGGTTGNPGTAGTSVTGTAGTSATGTAGTTGAGGTGMSCSSTFMATTGGLVTAPAIGGGCWRGYAFTFTETPNCGSTITPKDFSACTTTCSLSAMGMIATATAANSYCAVVGMGFNINQASGATTGSQLAPTGTGIKVSFTESAGTLPFRIQLRDEVSQTNYCYNATTSPAMIPYSSFNTKCYDTPADGTAYAKTPITSIQILVAGGAAGASYTMSLTSVSEY